MFADAHHFVRSEVWGSVFCILSVSGLTIWALTATKGCVGDCSFASHMMDLGGGGIGQMSVETRPANLTVISYSYVPMHYLPVLEVCVQTIILFKASVSYSCLPAVLPPVSSIGVL